MIKGSVLYNNLLKEMQASIASLALLTGIATAVDLASYDSNLSQISNMNTVSSAFTDNFVADDETEEAPEIVESRQVEVESAPAGWEYNPNLDRPGVLHWSEN